MYISHCSLLLSPWLPCVHEYLSTLYSRKKCQWILSCSPKLKSANIRTKLTKFCWSAACCSPWGCKESDTTKRLNWTELTKKERAGGAEGVRGNKWGFLDFTRGWIHHLESPNEGQETPNQDRQWRVKEISETKAEVLESQERSKCWCL